MAPVLYANIIRQVISLTHRSRKILYLITWRVYFFMHFLTFNSLLTWKLPHLGQGYYRETDGCRRSVLLRYAAARHFQRHADFPYSFAFIFAIVYHQKDTSFNKSSHSHASNDQNSLMLYYKKMIIVPRWWGENIIETKRRTQPVSKVIQASSMLLSRPYKCGTNGLWSDSNGIHGCHGSFRWDY